MDTEELITALAEPGHVPEQFTVMAAFERKRRRRARQRWSMAGGCLAAAAVIAAFLAIPRSAPSPVSSAASGAAASAGPRESANGAASGAESNNHMSAGVAGPFANECTPTSLAQRVTNAVRAGGSVIIANATTTGPTANGRQPVVLRDVQTLRGPRIASGLTADAAANFAGGGLRGQVFAIVLPAATGSGAGSGPAPREVLAAPVSGGTVRFGGAQCWDMADTPLAAVEQLATGK